MSKPPAIHMNGKSSKEDNMRIFGTLPQVAQYINRNHTVFGCPFATEPTLTILGNMNRQMMENPAIKGMTFKAWMNAEGYGILKTYITIEKHPEGGWTCVERLEEDL